jgi:septal ring factor EnvC (AmiA/AmiB activator)
MAVDQIAAGHPTETWSALVGSVAAVVALVGVLYSRINSDIKTHEIKLEAGANQFHNIGSQLITVGEQIRSITVAFEGENGELAKLEKELRDLHTRLTVIETEHRHCKAMLEMEERI